MVRSLLGDSAVTTPTPDERRVTDVLKAALLPMLNAEPQAVHFGTLAKRVLGALGDVARVPVHRGARSINGVDILGASGQVNLLVDARHDPDGGGVVVLGAALGEAEATVQGGLVLAPAEARTFFLAGLAACDAAQRAPGEQPPIFPPSDGSQDHEPNCATALSAVTLTSTGEAHPPATDDPKEA